VPAPLAELPKVRKESYYSNIGVVGSNPARGMDACPHVFVLCCPLQVEALWWADPWSKCPNETSKRIHSFRS